MFCKSLKGAGVRFITLWCETNTEAVNSEAESGARHVCRGAAHAEGRLKFEV
jgi:hypothetical protein